MDRVIQEVIDLLQLGGKATALSRPVNIKIGGQWLVDYGVYVMPIGGAIYLPFCIDSYEIKLEYKPSWMY